MEFPCLILQNPKGTEQIYELRDREIVIGRKSDSDIILVDPYISRRHARISPKGAMYWIFDLGSRHGTFVNGRRVEQMALNDGDRIRLGRLEFVYRVRLTELPGSITTDEDELQKSLTRFSSVFSSEAYARYSDLEKITWILDFQYHWERQFSWEKTFHQILRSALSISGAERGFVLVRRRDDFEYTAGMSGTGRLLSQQEFRTSRGAVQQVAETGTPVFMTEGIEGELAKHESVQEMNLRAVACLPLNGISAKSDQPQLLGILYLDSTKPMHTLSGLDQKILNRLAVEAGNVLEKLEMIKSIEERKHFEQELALAYETQKSLLPHKLPQFGNLRVRAFSEPTRYVGGDFYDFLTVRANELWGVLADVSGKGVSAALLSSLLQGALDTECRSGVPVAQVLLRVNRLLCERCPANRFATLFLFSLNEEGKGECVNAGHNPPYVYRRASGGLEELGPDGLILGAFENAAYASRPLALNPGDILVAFSDGVTDAENPAGDFFGEEKLQGIIQSCAPHGAQALEKGILDALTRFTQGMAQTDDITIVLVEAT